MPSREELERLHPFLDYTKISLNENDLNVPEGMQLDLGAVGKGYAADLAAETLRENRVESAILSLGGNIHAIGYAQTAAIGESASVLRGKMGTLGCLQSAMRQS